MDAQEFSQIWQSTGDTLESYELKTIEKLDITKYSKEFLTTGLPQDAAPFLRFGPSSGANLQSAADEYNLDDDFQAYKIIGFNAYGDPICLDINDGAIIYLNRDDEFGFVFMNSSISQLVKFLVLFRTFITDVKDADSDKVKSIADSLINSLRNIDSEAIEEGGWIDEVESVIE
jgi:hypothetical protein